MSSPTGRSTCTQLYVFSIHLLTSAVAGSHRCAGMTQWYLTSAAPPGSLLQGLLCCWAPPSAILFTPSLRDLMPMGPPCPAGSWGWWTNISQCWPAPLHPGSAPSFHFHHLRAPPVPWDCSSNRLPTPKSMTQHCLWGSPG